MVRGTWYRQDKQNKETTMEKVANTNTNVKSPLTPVSEAQKAQKNEHAADKEIGRAHV